MGLLVKSAFENMGRGLGFIGSDFGRIFYVDRYTGGGESGDHGLGGSGLHMTMYVTAIHFFQGTLCFMESGRGVRVRAIELDHR